MEFLCGRLLLQQASKTSTSQIETEIVFEAFTAQTRLRKSMPISLDAKYLSRDSVVNALMLYTKLPALQSGSI
jgi:hypothetical protein